MNPVPLCVAWTLAAAPALSVHGQERQRPTCALIPFHNATERAASAYLATVISQSLYPALRSTGAWQLMERARLKELLTESDLKAAGIATGRPVKITGADVVIVGEYRDDEGLVTVSARLVDAATGEIVRQDTWKGHVSGIEDDLPPRMASVLAGKPPPDTSLPPEMQARFEKACRSLARGRIDESIRTCTTILDRHRRHVPTLLLRGTAQLAKKGWSRYAAKDFERILEMDDRVVGARIGLARVKLAGDERSVRQAVQRLKEVLDEHPDHGEGLWLTALAHEKLGQTKDALSFATRATRLLPAFGPAWQTLARLQLRRGTTKEALPSALKATAFGPGDAASWMLLGDVQFAAGDRAAARQSFGKALECNPPPTIKKEVNARLLKFD